LPRREPCTHALTPGVFLRYEARVPPAVTLMHSAFRHCVCLLYGLHSKQQVIRRLHSWKPGVLSVRWVFIYTVYLTCPEKLQEWVSTPKQT
jgi:hypothetical protein